ncbi:MAG: TolC family protein [Bacteroidales bacterium]|jgi:outer membrane protein TolC|nr:TolC family protein [Bacteroidales bacterium]
MKSKYFKLIFLCLFPIIVNAQNYYELKDCINIGLEQNYDIKIIKNSQQISDNNATPGNAGYLPTISLDAGYNGNFYNLQNQYPNPEGDPIKNSNFFNQGLNAGLNLNWTIFDGFRVQTNYKKLKEFQKIGELNTKANIEFFINNLAKEYYFYIEQNIIQKNLENTLNLSKERLRIVQERYNIGAASRLDYQQANVDFNSDSSKLIQQNETLFSSLLRLNQFLAKENPEESLLVRDTIIMLTLTHSKEELLQNALNNNTSLLLLQAEKEISLLELKNANSQNYPYLKLNAGYGYNQNMYGVGSLQKQNNLGLNYGINFGYVIFDGMNRKRERENTKINIETKELEQQQLDLDLKSNFNRLWMAYQNNVKLSNLEQENVVAATENYSIAMDRYKLGDLSGIELREAQNSLLEVDQRFAQAQYNTKICEISLLQICGMLNFYLEK